METDRRRLAYAGLAVHKLLNTNSRGDTMSETNRHIVIVNFTVPADQQPTALGKIADYVDTFLSRQPGFIDSVLHRGNDGTSIVHYARWVCEADFLRAGEKAREHPDLPALRAWQPSGRGFTVHQCFQGD